MYSRIKNILSQFKTNRDQVLNINFEIFFSFKSREYVSTISVELKKKKKKKKKN